MVRIEPAARARGAGRAVHGRVGAAERLPQSRPQAGEVRVRSRRRPRRAMRPTAKSAPAVRAGARRRRAADAARAVRRLGRLYGEQRRQAGLLRARQAVLAGDAAAEPAARSGLYLRLHAPVGERAQRDLDRDRLSVQARLGGERRYRLGEIRDVHPERRRLGQEPRRGSPHGRHHAARLRPGGERRIRQGHEVDRPL